MTTDWAASIEVIRRYEQILSAALRPPLGFEAAAESAAAIQVERGIILAQTVAFHGRVEPIHASPDARAHSRWIEPSAAVERLIEVATNPSLPSLSVVDGHGHSRAVYRPLLVYSWLSAFQLAHETLSAREFGRWKAASRAWADLLEARLGDISLSGDRIPAHMGDHAAEACWTALALHVAGKVFIRDAWTELAGDVFGKLIRAQQPDGAFIAASPITNPETTWYHELVILHAAASYAAQAENHQVAAAVARAANFHLMETQPDHATSQPWGLFAFIWNPQTRSLADAMLHAISLHATPSNIALMLCADALYCVRLFLK